MDIIIDEAAAIIQPLNKSWYQPYVHNIDMLRLDLLHPVISGNKWYKLKNNLQHALNGKYRTIITFGGAYSNHLVATAAAAKLYGISCIGIVRGQYLKDQLTPTLQQCKALGMQLMFLSKEEYNKKVDPEWIQHISDRFNAPFIIPEGGANEYGRKGAADIAALVSANYTHICIAVGTGTTMAGIRSALPVHQKVYGFVPMKHGKYLHNYILAHLPDNKNCNWQLFDEWHFGGFGKWNNELINFMNLFYAVNQIPLDIVYTGKMMFGINSLLKGGFFPNDANMLCIHSGGLQGNASIKKQLNY